MNTLSSRLVLVVATLAAAASSQSLGNLVGGAIQSSGAPAIQRQTLCNPSIVHCGPILGAPPLPFAGGTAYDPIRQVVWDTDGPTLVGVSYTPSGGPCAITCPPMPVPGLAAGTVATGLAFEEGTPRGALWCVDSTLRLQRLAWASPTCPNVGAVCSIAAFMPTPNHRSGGLAVSEAHGLVFYSASDFAAVVPNSWVFAAPLANPCQPNCRLQITGCAGVLLGAITGLAFDDCTSTLYITDGRTTFAGTYTPAGGGLACQLTPLTCCIANVGKWYGLCVEPIHPKYVGASCLGAPCPACPNMALTTNGDPSLGNVAFGFSLSGAPTGVPSACLVNLGSCTAGIPFACGLIHLPFAPPPISLGTIVTAGPACAATGGWGLGIPLNPALCGIPLAAQALVVCPAFGIGLTNAACLVISDT